MDIRDFIDELYSLWAKTTGAENQYWMPKTEHTFSDGEKIFGLYAVGEDQSENIVADTSGFHSEADVNFITAIHGALPDLVRRTHEALDEADRLDEQRDEQEVRIAGLEETIDELNGRINELEHDLSKASK